ncbi:hypothetical protein EV361DRAFT_961947 [Lentinula raphanica]|nr:hypothetical protein EV361DRAFT_961947 [Lentinula raphanica]
MNPARSFGLPTVNSFNLTATGHVPPNDNPRAPDGFSYENEYSANAPSEFSIGSPLHFPARTTDNRDVMIAFLSDGVVDSNCVKVLRTIATGKNAGIDRNHALPLLHELRHDNMIFGVFPLVGTTFIGTWFVNIAHALEMMSQIMEGIAFLHDHLVAHRFSPDSDPATRMVTGPPLPWDIYRRPAPPEMKSDIPYCPFKADVWQVGKTFIALLLHIEHDIPDIIRLLRRMCDDNAEDRPSAREAVDQLNKIHNELPTEILQAPIEQGDWFDRTESSNEGL